MQDLPRTVIEEGCKYIFFTSQTVYNVILAPLLSKDCAVCKEQFKTDPEDSDELIIVTLPCHHPFHEPCIIPWLKSSGTCPVCRYLPLVISTDNYAYFPSDIN